MTVSSQELRSAATRGVVWTMGSLVGNQALNFVLQIVILRLLSPAEFGLVEMVVVFTGFAGIVADMGLGTALVQQAESSEEDRAAVFWFAILMGLGLFAVFVAGAPLIARFYGEPRVTLLTVVLAISFPVEAVTAVHYTLLKKQMEFRKIGLIAMLANLLSGTAGIVAAVMGLGVWSLVIQQLTIPAFTTAALLVVCPWRPRAGFHRAALRRIMGFSISVFVFNVFNYFVRNAGNLILGRGLGSVAVGLYDRAYSIMLLPLSLVSYRVGEVMFPAFCKIQDSPDRMGRIYLRTIRIIALITFPMMIGLWAISERFVLTVLGAKWVEITPLLQIGCIVGLVESIGAMNGPLYLARGRADLRLKVVLVIAPVSILAMVVGLKWGAIGVMYGYALYSLLITYPTILIPVKLVGLTLWDVTKALLGTFATASLMGTVVYLATTLMPPGASWFWLAVQVTLGASLYLLLVWGFRIKAVNELLSLLGDFLKQRAVAVGS